MRFINLLQTFFDDVGINLRGRNIRVAQHHLHGAQVRAAIEQVRGKTVPQHMRRQRFTQPRFAAVRAQNFPERDAV